MNPFGDGSSGSLTATSGVVNLPLNTKHQFTTVNIGASAVLSTASTTGSVLYILATTSITINGQINLSNKVVEGNNSWSVTIDGVTYSSPGVAAGANGLGDTGTTGGSASNGFGGGGSGASDGSTAGGGGGNGSSSSGSGGASISTVATTNTSSSVNGNNGSGSSGGGGGAFASFTRLSGNVTGSANSGNSGAGGTGYGANGANATIGFSGTTGGTGSYSEVEYAGGGGGAGGRAGKAGVHVVLKAPTIVLNGQIITSGTSGSNGGSGGTSKKITASPSGVVYPTVSSGMPGGGGGGGNAGNISVAYTTSITDTSTKSMSGGSGGSGGTGGLSNTASSGTSGSSGSFSSVQINPIPNFTADITNAHIGQTISFTNLSTGATSYLWDFGDGNTSTLTNPTHSYSALGDYTVKLTATNSAGSADEEKIDYINVDIPRYSMSFISGGSTSSLVTGEYEYGEFSIESGGTAFGFVTFYTTYKTLPQKEYEYRVFDKNGNFIGVWQDVKSSFSYRQTINENASELNVTLPRSPSNKIVKLDRLKDAGGSDVLDNNSDPILLQTESANAVGPDTDVDLNYKVEVYAYYGGYDQLLDENSSPILDNNSEPILTQFGYPNGRRVYSGYIADYELTFGSTTDVQIVIAPNATEMSHYIFKSGLNTTVPYNSTDPIVMGRAAIDNYRSQGGIINYDSASMPVSGTSVSYDFNLQTTREVIDKVVDLLPSGWAHYVHPGENKQYVFNKGATADHTFYYEKHLTELRLRKSITQLVNKVYFVGGEYDPVGSPGEDLFNYYEDTTSISNIRPGLKRISDSRVKLDSSASILSNREIAEFKNARYRTTIVITDAVYDIENINLGDMIAFKNFGTFVDTLLLQVVSVQREKHQITCDLDMSVPNDAKRLEDLKKAIMSEEIKNIPATPS